MSSTLAPFTVHCPSCEASFPVDPAKVPEGGIYAICSECERTFLVSVPEGEAAPSGVMEAPEAPSFAEQEAPETPTFGEEELVLDEVEDEAPAAAVESDEDVIPDFSLDPEPAEAEDEEPFEVEAEAPPAREAEAPAVEAPEAEEPEEAVLEGFEDLRGLASEAQSEGPSTHTGGSTLSEGAKKFGRRDPADRARRLARVLVSDIIAYYPERFQESRARGTVKDDFEAEVEKSWKEYVDQVGQEIAESTPYFTEALNEILAGGEEVF